MDWLYHLKSIILAIVLIATATAISITVAYYDLGMAALLVPHFMAGVIFQDVRQGFKK